MAFFGRASSAGTSKPSKTGTSGSGGKNPSGRTPDPRLKGRAGSHDYSNQDGPRGPGGGDHGTTVDYGPHKGGFSFDGLTSPRWSDRDTGFDYTPEKLAQEAAARQPYVDRVHEMLGGNEAYQTAKSAGDIKGQIAAMLALRQGLQQQRFVDQGGTAETWQDRFNPNNNWPVPKSPLGTTTHNPNGGGAPAAGAPPASTKGGASSGANETGGSSKPPITFDGYSPTGPQTGMLGATGTKKPTTFRSGGGRTVTR